MNAVEISGLDYTYGDGTKAIDNLSLAIAKGTKTAILGANGSGKTTLLHHLNGLILPQAGDVSIMGYRLEKKNLDTIRRSVGMVFDNPDNQLFSTTVVEDVAFGPLNHGCKGAELNDRVASALGKVGMLELANKSPHNLSLGQKKRVAIAGVLAMDPEILVLDEPISGLDPQTAAKMIELMEELYREGKSIILSTHDVDMAYTWAERVIILDRGTLTAKGSVDLLKDREVVEKAKLRLPLLVQIFTGTDFLPKSAQDANRILHQIREKE